MKTPDGNKFNVSKLGEEIMRATGGPHLGFSPDVAYCYTISGQPHHWQKGEYYGKKAAL